MDVGQVLGHLERFGMVHFGKVATKVLPILVFVCIKLNTASTPDIDYMCTLNPTQTWTNMIFGTVEYSLCYITMFLI